MRTGLTKQEKTTDIWFDEKDPLIHIRTHNTDLKKRLAAYAGQHPDQCRQTDADPETGCMEFDIAKGRFSFRLTAPYSEERRNAASKAAKKHSGNLTHPIGTENYPTDGQKIVPMMERKLSPNNLSSSNLNQNDLSRESEAPATYGRYENVFLSESEYAELLRDFPDRLDRLISELSSYMESTGRSYQNHAATIRRWAENAKTKGVPKQGIPDYTCKEGESL